MNLLNVPDQSEAYALWQKRGFGKGPSRVEVKEAARPLILVDDQAFKKIVRKRDKHHCRMCLRKVVVQLAAIGKRAEVHHVHGRRGAFKFDDRFALLVCLTCHEKLTGKVNEKWIVVGTNFIEIHGVRYIDARQPVTFARAA